MYLDERIKKIRPGRFVEIGPGAGEVSALLLEAGWTGVAYDLESSTVDALKIRFAPQIAAGRYRPVVGDWLAVPDHEKADLVISCMVLEHFDDSGEANFIASARRRLSTDGLMVTIVPGSPSHWGIEDEIAGHFRRYTSDSLSSRLASLGWRVDHVAGLTFPISNLLYPLANHLVRKVESKKLSLSMLERTKQSGIRNVPMKTSFPPIFGLLLNRVTMLPLHLLQKAFSRSRRAMVLYAEARPEQL
jgi:SAM-dependent methyltransferase